MKKVIMMLLGIAFAGVVWADPSVVIQKPAEGEFLGFVSALDGFSLPLQLGASDADFNNPDGFAVKISSGEYTLYDKSDILFRKEYPTDIEINEGLHYDPENLIQTATITVKTPDGRVTTSTFTFGLLPSGGMLVHNLDEVNAAIKTAKEEEWWDLVFVKTNDFPIASGKKIALPTLEEESKIYFAGDGKLDVSSIVPTFGTPYDVVTNFTTNNFVQVFEEWEYDEELGKWVDVTNVYTTVEKQLAQFSNTNDVAKLVFDAKRKTISLIGRGESEDYPWILDASTNVTAWVDANKKLVINNGLLTNSYDIDLVAMTNNFAKYKYTAPANALVKVVNGSTTKTVTSAGWVGANGTYATLGDAIAAGEAKVLPGYAVSYDANGAAGVMSNDVFAVNKQVTLKANAFSAVGYDFAGWATNGVDEVVYADAATVKDLAPVDGSSTLTAQWNATGVSIDAFDVLTNTLVAVTNQAASLPVAITLTGEIAVPQDGVITVNASPAITFAGEAMLDVSAVVPTFGTPTVVGKGFASTNDLALINTKGISTTVFDDGTISLVARGETEDFPWLLDATTNVTAWVESSNLVINNGLTAESYEIDLVALTNNVATYSYTPASPLNAVVKVGEADYKTPTCWIGESGSYATLGAALEAGETMVLPGYNVVYEANGAAGSMTNSYFAAATEATLTANAFSAVGYDFAGWATNGVDEVVYADAATIQDLAPVDGSATLTAQWTETGVSINDFVVLTNTLVAATNQAASLPVTITLTGEIAVPQDGVITVNASPAITFAGETMLDVSAVVPTFGTPTVVGKGFASTNDLALINTKGTSTPVFDDGTISLVARGESEEFPWLLDASTNVTAWVESSNLVINNGLTAESYEIDLVALTNNVATYSYTPASPLNAVVKVGEADYKTPTCWIGESASYTTLGAALEAGETMVLPGYEVVYEANGAAGSMTNSYFAAATEATLTANAFSAVGYDFAGWATNGVDEVVYADAATVQDLAPVDGSATLTAQWNVNSNGVTVTSFEALTNAIATTGLQGANLPITIGFTSAVTIPEDTALPTLPTGTGYDGLKYVAEEEGGSNLWAEDGVLYGDVLRGEVPVDALVLMQHAMGGTVTEFKALSEGEDSTIVTNDVVMLLGDNRQAYFNDTDSVDQMIADILAADPRPTTVKLYDVKSYWVSYDGGGAAGEMATDMFIPDVTTNLTANAFSAVGNAFVGWSTNDTDVIYADKADGANFTNPGATLVLTALWTKVETVPANYGALTNMIAQMTLPVTFTLTNDLPLAVGETVILPEGKEISFAGEGQFDVSAIVPQFGAPVVVGEGFADESALALFNTKDVSKLVFEDGEVSIVARGETEDFPWILDAEANVTAWVDPSLTNLAAVVIANGPAAESAIDLVALTNNLEVYGYTPEVTPLNALVKVVEAGETSYQIPTGWVGAEGTYATLEAALEAGETAVVPNFAVEEIPAVIAENAAGADGNVYTAVVANEPGEMTNAIRAVAAEGLLALATNELANVRLIVAAEAAADVAAEEAKIAAAITNDIPAVADLALDYVDLSVFFDDVPQTTLTEAIGICIPRTLNPQHDYAVARVHAGVAEALPVGAANAVEGEYVEFATDGLVVHTKKFSLYAIGEITPFTTVTVPTGLEGYSYVVSNLTAGVEMTIDSTVDGGVTYKLPVDAKVSITCVPEMGYVVDGEATYVIESVTKETTLVDVKLPAAREDDLLYPTGDGDQFVSAMKSTETFYGVLFGTNGMEGLVTLKMTRPNKRTGLFYIRATVKTLVDKASYTFQAKKVAVPETGVLTIELVGKSKQSSNHRLVVVLDGDSLTGAFDDWAIDGARDVFGIKNHPKRTALEPLVGTWTGILAGEDEKTVGAFFSVKITKTARAAVKVVAADGKAMSCSTKVEIGADGRGVVPVTVSRLSGGVRTSIGFRILFRQTAEGIVAKAVNVTPVRQWSKKTGLTTVSTLAFVGAEKLTVTAKQFRTDYVMKLAPTYAEVLGDPASETLKLDAYGRITGTIMWKVPYLDVHGHERIKSVSGKVTGIMVGNTGFGTVAVKLPTGERVAIDLELQKE